jgi:ABC-type phosphate transport system substrate-binding protein
MLKRSSDSCARFRRKCNALAGTVAMLFAAIAVAGFSPSPAAAQPGGPAEVRVTPSTELSDDQMVFVDWSGFPERGPTRLRQCSVAATDLNTQCTGIIGSGFTQEDGTAAGQSVQLNFGDVESVSNGLPNKVTFRCDPDTPCEIRLDTVNQDGATVFTTTTQIRASIFSKAFAPCPQGPLPLFGSGASPAGGAMDAWTIDTCNPPRSLAIDYNLRNSPGGREDFILNRSDFGVTGSSFTAQELDQLRQDGGRDQRFVYIPVTAGSMVLAYNFWIRDPDDGNALNPVRDLCLSAATVAEAYARPGTRFNDGEHPLIEDNDGDGDEPDIDFSSIDLGGDVQPVGRADRSNASLQLTSWFHADAEARDAWQSGAATGGPDFLRGPLEILPFVGGSDYRTGARAVATQVFDAATFQALPGLSRDFVFGIMDLSTARARGLPVARIRTHKDGPCVAPTDANVTAAISAMKVNADGTRSPNFEGQPETAYPLPNINYAIASTDGITSDPSKNDALRTFFDYALGDGQAVAAQRGYVPLPADLAAQGREALSRLPGSPASAPGGLEGSVGANTGLGNFDSTVPPLSPSSPPLGPSTPGGLTPGAATNPGSTGAGAGSDGGANDYSNSDTSGNALTRFLSSDKAIPILLIGLLTLSAIFGGPIMRIVARRRAGG